MSDGAGVGRREWDVALSYSSAQRDYVEQVSETLKAAGLRVYYSPAEQRKMWATILPEKLAEIFARDSRVVIVFASKQYVERPYPKLELQLVLSRTVHISSETTLLIARFDDTPLPGVPDNLVTMSLLDLSPADFARLVIAKLDDLGLLPPEPVSVDGRHAARTGSDEGISDGDNAAARADSSRPRPAAVVRVLAISALTIVIAIVVLNSFFSGAADPQYSPSPSPPATTENPPPSPEAVAGAIATAAAPTTTPIPSSPNGTAPAAPSRTTEPLFPDHIDGGTVIGEVKSAVFSIRIDISNDRVAQVDSQDDADFQVDAKELAPLHNTAAAVADARGCDSANWTENAVQFVVAENPRLCLKLQTGEVYLIDVNEADEPQRPYVVTVRTT